LTLKTISAYRESTDYNVSFKKKYRSRATLPFNLFLISILQEPPPSFIQLSSETMKLFMLHGYMTYKERLLSTVFLLSQSRQLSM
jgi:hypothetical protein